LKECCTEAAEILLAAPQNIKLNLGRNLSIVKHPDNSIHCSWLDHLIRAAPISPFDKQTPPANNPLRIPTFN
jgi:hypothetical protein